MIFTIIDHYLETVDLSPFHQIFCMVGCFLSIAVAQLSGHHDEMIGDGPIVIYVRRVAMIALGLALLWAASYSATKGWQPWAPDVLVILLLDIALAFRIGSILIRFKRLVAIGAPDQIRIRFPHLVSSKTTRSHR